MQEEPRMHEKTPARQSLPVSTHAATQAAPATAKPEETPVVTSVKPAMMTPETKARLFSASKAVFGTAAAEAIPKLADSIGVPSRSAELTESQARQLLLEIEKVAQ
jgi:hypothetical protein